ncbi:hypothetical protein [Lacipirellula sp.]|uniref:hypothetical protein n=1 Tax=Lacipirellula sp. TaxID=2691419 RepID=UPI003D12BBAD
MTVESSTQSGTGDSKESSPTVSPSLAAYNIVTDVYTGVNFRRRDNILQAKIVFATVVAASVGGAILAAMNPRWDLPWYGGALIGSFLGLVVGIFASGIFLMIYRAVRHLKGKHD